MQQVNATGTRRTSSLFDSYRVLPDRFSLLCLVGFDFFTGAQANPKGISFFKVFFFFFHFNKSFPPFVGFVDLVVLRRLCVTFLCPAYPFTLMASLPLTLLPRGFLIFRFEVSAACVP